VETAFLPLRFNADLECVFLSGNRGSLGLRQNNKNKKPSGDRSAFRLGQWRSTRTKGESIHKPSLISSLRIFLARPTLRRVNQID
jgi:hypothetical protein